GAVPFADAAVSGDDTLWVADRRGRLVALRFSDATGRFVEQQSQTVPNAGAQAVLVAHDRGVTLLAPDTGAVVQVGTGHDHTTVSDKLRAPLHAADTSPAELVPA